MGSIMILSLFFCLKIYLCESQSSRKNEKRRERQRDLVPVVFRPRWQQYPGPRNSILVSHVGGREASTWDSRCILEQQDQN